MPQHRAECANCVWTGDWHDDPADADREGGGHESDYAGHATMVHTEG